MNTEYLPAKRRRKNAAEVVEPVETGEAVDDTQVARPAAAAWIRTALDIVPPDRGRAFSVVRKYVAFWYVIPVVAVLAAIYFYAIADRLYVSEAFVSIRDQSPSSSSISSIVAQSFGASGSSDEDATLAQFIESREMLQALDKKLHLREAYSSTDWGWVARMRQDAPIENFLAFYQWTVTVNVNSGSGIIDIQVVDPNSKRAQAVGQAIVAYSEEFMNRLSDRVREATLRGARQELDNAMKAVGTAQPAEREVAETRLSTAQNTLAQLLGTASQQQIFLVHISEPSLASEPTLPMRFVDVLATILIAAAVYFILYLFWQNIRDHRKV